MENMLPISAYAVIVSEMIDFSLVTVSVPCLLHTVSWVCLQCVIVVFPGHTHLLFDILPHYPGHPQVHKFLDPQLLSHILSSMHLPSGYWQMSVNMQY